MPAERLVALFLERSGYSRVGRWVSWVAGVRRWLGMLRFGSGYRIDIHDTRCGQCQAASLTGAVHLSNCNVGVLRLAQ